jgi:hypothetical protein
VRNFKSRVRVVAAILLRSRETQAERAKQRTGKIRDLKAIIRQQERTIREKDERRAAQRRRIAELEAENVELRKQPLRFPDDPPLPAHEFGSMMIAMCVGLVRRVGFRATPDVLKIVFNALGIAGKKLPDWTTVRTWTLRVGVAAIERPVEPADDWIWMADHSNQIGPEKVLSVLGIRACHLPSPGRPLRHEDVRVLDLVVGTGWKREEMTEVYRQLAARCGGPPLALVVAGAVELREGAEPLQKLRETMLILRDFKHFAANTLQKVVGEDKRFQEFSTQLGRTRSSIQQTELAHFTPSSPRPKARFMNLASTLQWGMMVLWHLSHFRSESRRGITAKRMNEKLGWMREYRDDIRSWNACQDVVSAALTFINLQGVFEGAARELRAHVRARQRGVCKKDPWNAAGRRVLARLLEFVRATESQLPQGLRLPMSTEILESSFGLFKRLERQHSKGGFTSLLAAYGRLFHESTPETIRRDFAQVKVKALRAWVDQKLGKTLTAKRQIAYREFRHAN